MRWISSLLAHHGWWANITDRIHFCGGCGKPDTDLLNSQRKAGFEFNKHFSIRLECESITFTDDGGTVWLVSRVRGLLALMALDLTKGICSLKRTL